MKRPTTPRIAVLALGVLLLTGTGASQTSTGQLTGAVTDSTGASIPGATVSATHIDTGIATRAVTNAAGYYAIPMLRPGRYRVTVEREGFRGVTRPEVPLSVDQTLRLDFPLEVGSVKETVEVTATAPLVDSDTNTLGAVIENRRITDLPLNGRNALALVMLTPGVKSSAGPTSSGFGDRGTSLSAISINGSPTGMNNFLLDGANNTDTYQGGLNTSPPVDAVEEFKVETSSMSAEFGFTGGGVVNVVTKAGTNTPHGALYYFARNDVFDARNAFSDTRAPLRYHQFGGALGGPIVVPRAYDGRNRSFFFYNYEDWRLRVGANPIFSVPTAEWRDGDFSNLRDSRGALIRLYDPATTRHNPTGAGYLRDPFPDNRIPQGLHDPVSRNYLQFYPLPNRTPDNAFTHSNNYIAANKQVRTLRQNTTRLDHRFSDRNAMFWRYAHTKNVNDNGISRVLPDAVVRLRNDDSVYQSVVLSDTHTFTGALLNDFKVSVARFIFSFEVASSGGNWPQKLGLPTNIPAYTIPAVNNGLPAFFTGLIGRRGNTVWQFADAVTWIHGSHNVKFGAEVRVNRTNNYQIGNTSGSFSFPATLTGNPAAPAGTGYSFATFLLGTAGSAAIQTGLGQAQHGYSASFFVQDSWKVTRRLTLNMGLRHDYQPWPVERYNRVSNFDPYGREGAFLGRMTYAGIDYGRAAMQNDWSGFGPRLGFAWNLTGTNKTVLRGGYGIFYPLVFEREYFGSGQGFSSTTTTYQPPGNDTNFPALQFRHGFPSPPLEPLGSAYGPLGFLGQSVSYSQRNERLPMSQQWNLSLQRQFAGNWMAEAAYSGNRGTRLLAGSYDLNELDPAHLALGQTLQNRVTNPYAGLLSGSLGAATLTLEQSLRPYPYYPNVLVRNPHTGSSIYHSLFFTVQKRFGAGVTLLSSYTFAKLISDSVRTMFDFAPYEQTTVVGYQSGKYDRRQERSLDPTDVSQRWVMSGVYELPFGEGKRWQAGPRWANKIAGGWQVNAISTIQSGLPVVVRGASNFRADRPNSTGASAKLDNRTGARWFDAGAFVNPPNYTFGNVSRTLPDVRTPGAVNLDVSLIKDTVLGEGWKVQFRAEAFSALNHVNLGLPDGTFAPAADGRNRSATFGTISSAREARILQLGMKVVF